MAANGVKLTPVETGSPFKKVLYHQRVRWVIVSLSIIVLMGVVALGAGKMAVDIILQSRMNNGTFYGMVLGLIGGFLVVGFVSGQLSARILKGGWDSWIAELGPNEILMLISNLSRAYKTMTGQEVPRSSAPIR
jgi:hypothetical protein